MRARRIRYPSKTEPDKRVQLMYCEWFEGGFKDVTFFGFQKSVFDNAALNPKWNKYQASKNVKQYQNLWTH